MILHIALKDLKIILRDRQALAVMLLMPAVIMLILGSAVGPMFENNLSLEKFSIGVVNRDNGIYSGIFVNMVLRGELSDMINTYVVDEESALRMMKDKIVPAIIIIPEDFTKNIYEGTGVEIAVKSQTNQQFKAGIIKNITDGFAQQISQSFAVARAAKDVLNRNGIEIEKNTEAMSELDIMMQELRDGMGEGLEFAEVEQEKNRTVSGMQYYAVAMLVMFMLFGASNGVRIMVEEREKRTLGRLLTTRAGKAAVITGKFLGLMLICLTQAFILIVFTRFVYGVDWGSSIPGIMLVTVCTVFAAAALGMMIAAIAKSVKAAEGISQIFIQVFTLIGGGMIPLYVMPDLIRTFSKVTINRWAIEGYYQLILGSEITAVFPYCGVLIMMGFVYLSAGILKFKT